MNSSGGTSPWPVDQEQAEHQRQLDQGDGVDLAVGLHLDPQDDRGHEQHGQQRPRQAHGRRRRRLRRHRPHEQGGADRQHGGRERQRRGPATTHT
jgi:hypothetical protein